VKEKIVECSLDYELPVSPEEIWPYLVDTSRMNRDLGLPPREEKEINGENHITTVTLGRKEEWIERPWTWVYGKEVHNHRVFLKGWMKEQRGTFSVKETSLGCLVTIYFRWSFSSAFNRFLFSFVPAVMKKKFDQFFQDKVKIIQSSSEDIATHKNQTLREYFMTGDPLELDRIHVKKVSRELNLPLENVISECVGMVKKGDMSVSWDVVCPHCRGVRSTNSLLSSLQEENKCEPCGVTFNLETKEAIEVVFHLSPGFRMIPKLIYCAAEPAKKKHIKLIQEIRPGETKEFSLHLPSGRYRLRRKDHESRMIESKGNLELKLTEPGLHILEEAWWFDDRLLVGEALSDPSIRGLISEDHLNIGLKLNVGTQVILFTDIVGSTPFFKKVGDAVALQIVQTHYREVARIIEAHGGAVVKFIGDAVMAAYPSLEKAMESAIAIHHSFDGSKKEFPIKLRASLHEGNVLCANLNVGVDYFGSTVNRSAKIQKYAESMEIAVTEEDWQKLKEKFPELKEKPVIHDAKLEVNVRVLSV
jgi:class 3 adenylate cyclase